MTTSFGRNACWAFAALVAIAGPVGAAESWAPTGAMNTARYVHTATLLADGRVLVTGGDESISLPLLASAEIYNPATEAWSPTAVMSTARYAHTATLLNDGQVLVSGGSDTRSTFLASAEIFNPATGSWSPTGSMSSLRQGHTSTLLPNGRVLVTGGGHGTGRLATAEIYNPATGTWSSAGSMSSGRNLQTATRLPDGRVLVAGGGSDSGILASADIYNPTTGTWSTTGSMSTARAQHTATLLPDGRVLVAGDSGGGTSAEIYNPGTGTWSVTGSLNLPRPAHHKAALLPDGRVLLAGGSANSSTTEIYQPATGTWTLADSMSVERYAPALAQLADGRVLISGGGAVESGWDGTQITASTEIFTADASGPALLSVSISPADAVIAIGQTQQYTATGTFSDGSSRTLTAGYGTWASNASMPVSRFANAVAGIGGVLYAVGGTNYVCGSYANLEAYDPLTNAWSARPSMATPRWSLRSGVINGILYAVGGTNGCYTPPLGQTTVEAYNPVTNSWSTSAPMLKARSDHGVGVVNGILYAMGGNKVGGGVDSTLEGYDPGTNAWTLKAAMPTPRYVFGAGVVDGVLYAVGGSGVGGVTLASVDAYDPVTNTWSSRAPLPAALSGITVEVVNGTMYALGGHNGSTFVTSVYAYDPATNSWSSRTPMLAGRGSLATGVIDGVLYAVGGSNGAGPVPTVESYTPAEITWSSSDSAVAAIDANGLATGASAGTVSIVATADALTGSTSLTVAGANDPPVANAGPDQTVEAISAAGAAVMLNGVGSADSDGDALGYTWSGPFGTASGATATVSLALGTHTITLTVYDGTANDSDTVTVQVVDTTPPLLMLPSAMTVEATSASGASIHFVASVVDAVDPAPAASCSPASGSTFAIGTTTVSCSGADFSGNVTGDSFAITVADTTPPQLSVPDPITVFAAYPDEALIDYIAVAVDTVDPAPSAFCSPLSGTTFGLGTTNVFCSAADATGNGATAGFTVTVIDSGAPLLTVPGDLTASASSAAGGVVIFAVTASDGFDADPAVSCTPASGSTFALGTTSVTCTATDDSGNGASATFDVTVVDDGAPALTVPADIIVNATSPAGAIVSFMASANDSVDSATTVSCVPPSGSTFPIGITAVSCTATDASGNSVTAGFDITVRGAAEQVGNAAVLLDGYDVPAGVGGSLMAKLENAQDSLGAGNIGAACNQIKAFINEVKAQRGKALTFAQADALIDAARQIQAAAGC